MFVFYNLQDDTHPIVINYTRSGGDVFGEYEILAKKSQKKDLSHYKHFLKETNKYVEAIFGSNEDINSSKNYIAKWNIENGDFDEGYIDFLEYKSDELFQKYAIDNQGDTLENNRYIVFAGFASPILAYDKLEKKTLVLWVPAGFPNGCCWGTRSFYLKSFKDNIVTAESQDDGVIKIDITNRKIEFLYK